MRCCDCEFRHLCDETETVLTAFVSCEKRSRLLAERNRKQTNADRIRAMTDEELADFIDKCEGMGFADSSIAREKNGYRIDMLDWLQQPAKEAE